MTRIALEKEKRSTSGSLSPDCRGRHEPANKLSPNDFAAIHEHLDLLPKVPAHWCRRDTSKIFIEGFNTKNSLHQHYLSFAAERGLRLICERTYCEKLKELNIGFYQPRKDQCWCAGFHKLSVEDRAEQQEQYDLHIRRKEAARKAKIDDTQAAKTSAEVLTAVFDMEAILYSLFFKTKELFYKRKLVTHNFTIFDLKTNQGKKSNKSTLIEK